MIKNGRIIFFEGVPSPAGGLLILTPLVYELSEFNLNFSIKDFTPYLTILIALLLVSKIPTLSLKKISISSKTTIFLLLTVELFLYHFYFILLKLLLVFGIIYFYFNSTKYFNL